LGRLLFLRLATVVIATEAPAAVGLIALTIKGKLAPGWTSFAIAGGVVAGTIAAAALNRILSDRAERRLLNTADTAITTIGSLDTRYRK
jgi:hypothetical protein